MRVSFSAGLWKNYSTFLLDLEVTSSKKMTFPKVVPCHNEIKLDHNHTLNSK